MIHFGDVWKTPAGTKWRGTPEEEVQCGIGASALFRIFLKMESFFFVLAFLPQGKRCFQTETQSFKNGLLSGDFLKTPAYRFFFAEGKGSYRTSFVISFSCARAKTGHTLHVYANFFENGEKKYPFFPFRYVRTWRRPLTSKNAYQIDDCILVRSLRPVGEVSGTFIC